MIAPAGLVVGQDAQVSQVLQPPRFAVAAAGQEHVREGKEELRTCCRWASCWAKGIAWVISCRARTRSRLRGVDRLAVGAGTRQHGPPHTPWHDARRPAGPTIAAFELAGDDEALVLDSLIVLGSGPQEAPIVLVGGNYVLEERVGLDHPVQALKAVDAQGEVFPDLGGVILGIEGQLADPVVGVLVVAGLSGLLQLVSRHGALLRFGGAGRGQSDTQDAQRNKPSQRLGPLHKSHLLNWGKPTVCELVVHFTMRRLCFSITSWRITGSVMLKHNLRLGQADGPASPAIDNPSPVAAARFGVVDAACRRKVPITPDSGRIAEGRRRNVECRDARSSGNAEGV